jgi:hypothetical protein
MSVEDEAYALIRTLESLISDLHAIARGKNYTDTEAREHLSGVRMALGAEDEAYS